MQESPFNSLQLAILQGVENFRDFRVSSVFGNRTKQAVQAPQTFHRERYDWLQTGKLQGVGGFSGSAVFGSRTKCEFLFPKLVVFGILMK